MTDGRGALPSSDKLIGAAMGRLEDARLLEGRGEFVADLRLPRMVDVAFARSTLPHARVRAIGVTAAAAAPGVVGVFSARDMIDVTAAPDLLVLQKPVAHFPLARDKVRHVGEAMVAVVATDRYLAEDVVELLQIDLDELPVVADPAAALAPDAPLLYEDWGDNVMCEAVTGDPVATDALFAQCRVVSASYRVQRQGCVPMEPRGVVADWDGDRLTIWSSTQVPHMVRGIAAKVLGLSERTIRVVAPDVGGGFGLKSEIHPEEYIVPWLAIRLGRPVRWLEDRYEHLVAASQSRDVQIELEGAFRDDRRLVAVRGRVTQDSGTGAIYPSGGACGFVSAAATHGPYRLEQHSMHVVLAVTNKMANGAYRGFGAPEGIFAIERLMDQAAAEFGMDPVELRRCSLLTHGDLPYRSPTGAYMDSGSHHEALTRAAELGAAAAEEERSRLGDAAGTRIGWGVVPYVQGTAATYFAGTGYFTSQDSCTIRFDPDGGATVALGIAACGQGAVTTHTAVAASALGLSFDAVRVVMGDTDTAAYGLGAWGSRGAVVGAGSIELAAAIVVEKGRRIAAHFLGADPAQLDVADGWFHVRDEPDRRTSWAEVAAAAMVLTLLLPPDVPPGLEASATYQPPGLNDVPTAEGKLNAAASFNNQAHAAVVQVDIETGHVAVLRYVVVNDCGTIINPTLVAGQLHGGVGQGVGAALLEDLAFVDGVPTATTLASYLVPTAYEVPPMSLELLETPDSLTPYGIKGVGEASICGPPPVIAQAIDDALRGLDATPLRVMPFTAERVMACLNGSPDGVGAEVAV
ncbi:molybdopterin-dependent oxidoreductase [soil metagenome]